MDVLINGFFNALLAYLKTLPLWLPVLVAALIYLLWFLGTLGHINNVFIARRSLKKLRAMNDPAHQISYLRHIDPFVFEEMILTAIKDSGGKITRNKRYTGDFGVDGKAKINGKRLLIQAKRYKGHIDASHVKDFADLCQRSKRYGLFVHTGKTGKKSWDNSQGNTIEIISGRKMLALLAGEPLTFAWE